MNFVLIGLLYADNQLDVVMPHNQKFFKTLLILVIRFGWLLFNENSLLQDFCQTKYGKSRFITPRRLVVSFIDGNELNQYIVLKIVVPNFLLGKINSEIK